MMVRFLLSLCSLALLVAPVNAQVKRAIMEGTAATSNAIYIDTTNVRVGVGTASPAYRLDIYGNVRTTGTYYGDGSGITGTPVSATLQAQVNSIAVSTGAHEVRLSALDVSTGSLGSRVTATELKIATAIYSTVSYADPAWLLSLGISKINLSTVTLALNGKLDSGVTVPPSLIDLSTVTTALSGKLDNTITVPSSLISLSTVTSALNGKLDNTATVPVGLIDLSTVTSALSGKLSNTVTVPSSLVDLSTVASSVALKLSKAGDTMTGQLTINTDTTYPLIVNAPTSPSVPSVSLQSGGATGASFSYSPTSKVATVSNGYSFGGGSIDIAGYPSSNITLRGDITSTGTVTATKFYGDGASLSNVATSLVGVRYSTDAVSTALIDLSTITTALNGKLSNSASISPLLIDLSTVTTALGGKLSNSVTVPTTLVDLSTVTSALAGKLSSSASIPPALIDLSTVATALNGKLSSSFTVSPSLIDLSTVTSQLGFITQNLSTAVYTSGNQSIAGTKNFTGVLGFDANNYFTPLSGDVTYTKENGKYFQFSGQQSLKIGPTDIDMQATSVKLNNTGLKFSTSAGSYGITFQDGSVQASAAVASEWQLTGANQLYTSRTSVGINNSNPDSSTFHVSGYVKNSLGEKFTNDDTVIHGHNDINGHDLEIWAGDGSFPTTDSQIEFGYYNGSFMPRIIFEPTYGDISQVRNIVSSGRATFARDIVASSSVTAGGDGFHGSGAGLTSIPSSQLSGGVPASLVDLSTVATILATKANLASATFTGQLTTASSITIQGTAFSVGGSTLSVAYGVTTANIILSSNGLSIPWGNQRPTSPYAGSIRFDTTSRKIEVYDNTLSEWGTINITFTPWCGTGGDLISYDSISCTHTFTQSGTFTPPSSIAHVSALVVGGGGGGGQGGGGGGGVVYIPSMDITQGAHDITIGAGGSGVLNAKGTAGSNSVFNSTTAYGGGYGGYNTNNGGNGGSGGGAGAAGQQQLGGSPTDLAFGKSGANNGPADWLRTGGGGGAGQAGAQGTSVTGGKGGNGLSVPLSSFTATSAYYGGGGGGTYWSSGGIAGAGGAGGGASGLNYSTSPSINGTPNTGGGGGSTSASGSATGGYGGSGIVIISYTR